MWFENMEVGWKDLSMILQVNVNTHKRFFWRQKLQTTTTDQRGINAGDTSAICGQYTFLLYIYRQIWWSTRAMYSLLTTPRLIPPVEFLSLPLSLALSLSLPHLFPCSCIHVFTLVVPCPFHIPVVVGSCCHSELTTEEKIFYLPGKTGQFISALDCSHTHLVHSLLLCFRSEDWTKKYTSLATPYTYVSQKITCVCDTSFHLLSKEKKMYIVKCKV